MRYVSVIAGVSLLAFNLPVYAGVPKATDMWFDPSPDWKQSTPGKSLDYQQLFTGPTTAWPVTYSTITTFSLPIKLVTTGPDAELTEIINFTKAHGIKLAVTFPGVLNGLNNCGSGIEGYYGAAGDVQREAQTILNLGGTIDYAVIDTPFYFGHQDTEVGACQFSVTTLAKRVAAAVREVHNVYPFAKVEEDESPKTMAAVLSDAKSYYQALANDGVSLESVFFGIQGGGQTPPDMQSLANMLQSVNVTYSLIMLGGGQDTSDAAWVTDAQQKTLALGGLTIAPLAMSVASYGQPYPKNILPESTFGSFTSLSAWYIKQAGLKPLR